MFALYFRPSALETIGLKQTLIDALKAGDRSRKSYFGLFPFRWQDNWEQSFQALRGNGRPLVAPILQTLILIQAPKQVLAWADQVAGWDFQQIISCHFDAPFQASPQQFRQAFTFLEKDSTNADLLISRNQHLPETDLEFIRNLEANLVKRGIATPPREKV